MVQKTKVAIGLGGNVGTPETYLKQALARLEDEFLENIEVSSFYLTKPWRVTDQPDFMNAVAVGLSEWKPPAIVNYLKSLEQELGRTHTVRYGPREIDLDLIAYGSEVWESEGVTVPHERMTEREFVLLPLQEVWPTWNHPSRNRTAVELWSEWKSRHTPSAVKQS